VLPREEFVGHVSNVPETVRARWKRAPQATEPFIRVDQIGVGNVQSLSMQSKREFGRLLFMWLTAASTLVGSFPISQFRCCCLGACPAISEQKAAPETQPCCKSKSSTVPNCGGHDLACRCCAQTTPHSNTRNPLAQEQCPCSTNPKPQPADPISAQGLLGPDFQVGLVMNLTAMPSTFDVPSVGNISSCGTAASPGSPQLTDLVTSLSRLTC
jgi:hypothetical protein